MASVFGFRLPFTSNFCFSSELDAVRLTTGMDLNRLNSNSNARGVGGKNSASDGNEERLEAILLPDDGLRLK